ncbi:MAG: hypothetical protein KGJ13_02770 [Patescibacteria group bacterium]|nr:hypothetical protein [Patescibacteria group bacterium]
MKLDFLKPKERFLILEVLPGHANALFLSVDEDRNVVFENLKEGIDLKKFLKSPVRRISQKTWEGKHLFDARRRVIVIADAGIATTIPVPVAIERAEQLKKEKITVLELENLVAQEMKKIFAGCRSEAARRLGIDPLHAVLVGSKIEEERVDGKGVADAVGRIGSKISFALELTFTGREMFEDLKQFFSSPEGFFFAESPQTHLRFLEGARELPLNLLAERRGPKAENGERNLSLFILQAPGPKSGLGSHPVLYRETFNWGFDSLFRDIETAFCVSRAVAEELYISYAKGKMSENALKYFKKTIEPAVERLLKEVERSKISGHVYVDAPFAPPFPAPYRHQGAVFSSAPVEELLKKFDFAADAAAVKPHGRAILPEQVSRYLAPFFEAYFDRSRSEINQRLRKKLHWLAE